MNNTKDGTTPNSLKITFGLKYDTAIPEPFSNKLGSTTVGPLGFLGMLENQLGIPNHQPSFTSRLIQYLAALDQANHKDAFYAASFEVDPFSVARTLLQWRDHWYLAGWTGVFASDVPPRLQDMADVEKNAADVAKNVGQRIQHVISLLETNTIGIEYVALRDEIKDFPVLWRTLLGALDVPVHPPVERTPQASKNTDLGLLQRHLLKQFSGGATEKLTLENDGTVNVLSGHSADKTTVLTATMSQQRQRQSPEESLVVLSEARGDLLDEAMEEIGAPRFGFSALSHWRPIFQVLPLSFELLWEPLSPTSLFQFLSHPVGPISGRAREKLAQTVQHVPGIGSEVWNQTLDECLTDELEAYGEEARTRLESAIEYWLNSPRFSPQVGISSEFLRERAAKVADWLIGIRDSTEDPALISLYTIALNQALELQQAMIRLSEAGRDTLTRDNVLRLMKDVRGSGAPLADRYAEVSPGETLILRANHSGSFYQPINHLVWWDCQATDHVHRWPFSRTELEVLAANGVMLQSESEQLAWLGKAWLRPILTAKDTCTLVLHDDADRHHPLWEQIAATTEGLTVHSTNDPNTAQALGIQEHALEAIALPEKHRWWQLSSDVALPRREFESYSSLDAFINSPYQWLLNYAARFRTGTLASIQDGSLLKGNIAHRLFEQFFIEHPQINDIQTGHPAAWIDDNATLLIQAESALLLEPGRQAECEQVVIQLQQSLSELVMQLKLAQVSSVSMEMGQEGNFSGGKLTGSIDLLAHREDGTEAVVDIKWGGLNYRRDALRSGNYLQLATYAKLREGNNGQKSPHLSYFIVTDAHMLNLNHDFFPTAENIVPDSGENSKEFWMRTENSWKWRRAQFDQGQIEVTIEGSEPGDNSQPGDLGLVIPDASDTFNDFRVLTGWERNA